MNAILQYPHPLLRMKCDQIVDFAEARVIAARMRAAASAFQVKLIGLAANQVGALRRIVIVLQGSQWVTLVNPVIVRSEGELTLREGCASFDFAGSFKVRTRPSFIQVEYQDELGNGCRRKAKGIHAACIAHEVEHLDGRMFFDEPSTEAA